MLPPTIFFFIALHIVAIVRALMTKGTGISLPTTGAVTIAALILGKSVLLANMLPFINRFPEKPLIWNAAWKTLIYMIIATIIHFLEKLYDFWKETHGLGAANKELLANLNWPHFMAIQLMLLVLVGNYCVFVEIARVLGRGKMRQMFFGPMPAHMPLPATE